MLFFFAFSLLLFNNNDFFGGGKNDLNMEIYICLLCVLCVAVFSLLDSAPFYSLTSTQEISTMT